MPLRVIIEPLVESVVSGVVEATAEVVAGALGDAVAARFPLLKRSYSDAYCKSFFCHQCPGMAKAGRVKRGWRLYRCQDCGSDWGVLKSKPWVRREKRTRLARRPEPSTSSR